MESSNRGKRKSSDNLNNTNATTTENETCLDEPAAKQMKIDDEENNVVEKMVLVEEILNENCTTEIAEGDISLTDSVVFNETNAASSSQEIILNSTLSSVDESGEKEEGEVPEETENAENNWDIKLEFNNCQIAEMYKEKFMKFIQSFVELEIAPSSSDLELKIKRDELLRSTEWHVVEELTDLSELKEATDDLTDSSPSKKHRKKKNKKEKPLFVLDTSPMEEDNNKETNMKYSAKFSISTSQEEDGAQRISNGCFNCGKNHALKDCPEPKDFTRINNARNKMKGQKNPSRYHMEDDQKYGHIKPGKISNALREALGLRKNQLPGYVYTMRILGYPPGWLEEAKYVNSNLNMFDSEGKTVKKAAPKKKKGLDPEKIVDYPGFNVPMEKGYRDEYRDYKVPQYSDQFSKEAMVKYFAQIQEANKSEDDDNDDEESKEQENELEEKPENGSSDSKPDNPEETQENQTEVNETSLLELEKQKLELLAELNENSNSNSINSAVEKVDTANNETVMNSSDENIDLNQSMIKINEVRTTCFGTPILKSSSPYNRLPNPDNFQKDVSPVINFENLPNSTGKYEQMTEVLQKVRNKLKDLQNT